MPNPRATYLIEDRGYQTPCWVWQAVKTRGGYCQTRVNGRLVYAHRWMYVQHRGPIPTGKQLDHLCRVRNCVNPDHLEIVTNAENCRRGVKPKLTQEVVDATRVLHEAGVSGNALARLLGVSTATMHQALNEQTWVAS